MAADRSGNMLQPSVVNGLSAVGGEPGSLADVVAQPVKRVPAITSGIRAERMVLLAVRASVCHKR
jgi:hypothetical protein